MLVRFLFFIALFQISTANAGNLRLNGAPTWGVVTTNLYHNYNVSLPDGSLDNAIKETCSSKVIGEQGKEFAAQLASFYAGRNVTGVVIREMEATSSNGRKFKVNVNCFIKR